MASEAQSGHRSLLDDDLIGVCSRYIVAATYRRSLKLHPMVLEPIYLMRPNEVDRIMCGTTSKMSAEDIFWALFYMGFIILPIFGGSVVMLCIGVYQCLWRGNWSPLWIVSLMPALLFLSLYNGHLAVDSLHRMEMDGAETRRRRRYINLVCGLAGMMVIATLLFTFYSLAM